MPSPQNPHKPELEPAPEVEPVRLPFPEPHELWRREQYLRMGFGQVNAYMLASNRHLNWHSVQGALESGASHDQLMRIFC